MPTAETPASSFYAWFGTVAVQICGATETIEHVKPFFRSTDRIPTQTPSRIAVEGTAGGLYNLTTSTDCYRALDLGRLIQALRAELICEYDRVTRRFPYFGSAVDRNGSGVVLLGTGAGKSTLFAWLLNRGFSWVSDGALDLIEGRVVPLLGPLRLRTPTLGLEGDGPVLKGLIAVCTNDAREIAPPADFVANETSIARLVILPRIVPGAQASSRVLTREEALKLLYPDLGPGSVDVLPSLPEHLPCIEFVFSSLEQLECNFSQALRAILDYRMDGAEAVGLLNGFRNVEQARSSEQIFPIPEATVRAMQPRLTIGMATYDDYDGVYFSIQALRLYHSEVMKDVEIVVLDNNPTGKCAASLKMLEQSIENFRYVPHTEVSGTVAKYRLFQEAQGDFVLGMDCHVFFHPGSIARLLQYFDDNPETEDLLQGPLVRDDLKTLSTHFEPRWRGGMYGTWGLDQRGCDIDGDPFEIPMQGLGAFACRKAAWPGFNAHFRGFGGEEGYVHEKFRQRGARTLCLPFFRWLHRFQRPFGVPYRNIWEDRVRNYLIGYSELGQSSEELRAHMSELIGKDKVDGMFADFELEFGWVP